MTLGIGIHETLPGSALIQTLSFGLSDIMLDVWINFARKT